MKTVKCELSDVRFLASRLLTFEKKERKALEKTHLTHFNSSVCMRVLVYSTTTHDNKLGVI